MSDSLSRAQQARLRFLRRDARTRTTCPPLPRALREECGVFGIIGYEGEASSRIVSGLHALQHRGEEAAGIITCAGDTFHEDKHIGLVGERFFGAEALDKLKGSSGIGHTRYSTTGGSSMRNVQPFYAALASGGLAMAHNGNLTNARTLRAQLIEEGRIFHTTSDSEVFVKLVSQSRRPTVADRIAEAVPQVEGAYALISLTKDQLIGVRDPVGIRPLVLGRLGNAPVLASETCALSLVGAEFVRDVDPGEMVVCRADGSVESRQIFPNAATRARSCVFEMIYFARPDSFIHDECAYEWRKRLGAQLAKEAPADVDLVSPIPDGGVPAAIGYANEAGLPYDMGLIRAHYAGRTFIQPTPELRREGVARKLSPNRGVVDGKRVLLIDDSLVRGTTTRKLAELLRQAGAKEVHFRIASPPIRHQDYYGIDLANRDDLMAATHSLEEIRQSIGADSLEFLSIDGMYEALGQGHRDPDAPAFSDHCFTGDYPTDLTDRDAPAAAEEAKQYSLSLPTGA